LALQSPELTPIDYFLGYVRNIVYSERVESLPNLHQRITVAITVVPVNVLSWVWGEVKFNFYICRAVSGAHIQLH
jgi:hypothetical protein